MSLIQFTSITGITYPYTVYVCNVYGLDCVLVAVINAPVPAPVTIVLPPQFDSAPAVGIKVITTDGCERFNILYCTIEDNKLFQDGINFAFEDGFIYLFEFQNYF